MKKSTTLIMLLLILLQSTGWSDIYLAKKNGDRYDRKFRLTTEGTVTEGDVTESIPTLQSGSLVLSRSNGSTYEHLAEFTAGDQIHLTGKVKENQNPFSQSNLLGFTYRRVEQGQVVYKPRALFSYHSGTKNYSDLELKGLYNALQLRRVTSYIGSSVFETDKGKSAILQYVNTPSGKMATSFDEHGNVKYDDHGNVIYEYYHYVTDHLGSARMVLAAQDENILHKTTAYNSYGTMHHLKTPTNDHIFREEFTGKEFDEEGVVANRDATKENVADGIKLFYFGARYYDGELGIWTSPDPADQFWSGYGYVGAGINPIIGVDPSGESIVVKILNSEQGEVIKNLDDGKPYVFDQNMQKIATMNDPRLLNADPTFDNSVFDQNVDKFTGEGVNYQFPVGTKVLLNQTYDKLPMGMRKKMTQEQDGVTMHYRKMYRTLYTLKESLNGNMDFESFFSELRGGSTKYGKDFILELGIDRDINKYNGISRVNRGMRPAFILDGVLYNVKDFGNYWWGYENRILGHSLDGTLSMADKFAWAAWYLPKHKFNYWEWGKKGRWDEIYDTQAIINGYFGTPFNYGMNNGRSIEGLGGAYTPLYWNPEVFEFGPMP